MSDIQFALLPDSGTWAPTDTERATYEYSPVRSVTTPPPRASQVPPPPQGPVLQPRLCQGTITFRVTPTLAPQPIR